MATLSDLQGLDTTMNQQADQSKAEEERKKSESAKQIDQYKLSNLKIESGKDSPEYKDSVQAFMAKWKEAPKGEQMAAPAVVNSVSEYMNTPQEESSSQIKGTQSDAETPIKKFEKEVAGIKPGAEKPLEASQQELDIGGKIDAARDKYEEDKKTLGSKEAWARMATALLNFGAAFYAGKSGANMEGYKGMDLPDFSKEREELGRDYSRNLDYYEKRQTAEQSRKERLADNNAALGKEERGRAYSAAELKYKQAMDDELKKLEIAAKQGAKSEEDYQKRLAELNEAKNQLTIMQTDEDPKVQARAKQQMLEHLGNARVPADQITAATTKIDKAWYNFWGEGSPAAKDPEEISLSNVKPVRNFESGVEAAKTPATETPSTDTEYVKIKAPSGTVQKVRKDAAQKYLSKPGYSLVP